ncbi:hypothetical protein [Gordonia araii]|uniref:hypothetical protein n=1 Tax=Gordonia araii TaxID=263909 RepID=UPI00058D98F5|nr:hypothetical protein [Gordonia araii]NNG97135.1 hypothetical protein [Gordonia araii NBRC 100433]
MSTVAETLNDFAVRFQDMHATVTSNGQPPSNGSTPHMAMSPLAMWAPLALLGTSAVAADSDVQPSVAAAEKMIHAVLRQPHPACPVSAGLWIDATVANDDLAELVGQLADYGHSAGAGIPVRAQLDKWASSLTGGIVPWFPLDEEDDSFAILSGDPVRDPALVGAVAFTSSGDWPVPLATCWAGALSESWGIDRALQATGPDCGLAWDPSLGYVGVTVNRCGNGLFTISVIADPDVPDSDVTAAAARLARRFATGEQVLLRNVDLPSGDHGWWRVDDSSFYDGFIEQQHNSALIPAWSAGYVYDVMQLGLGYWGVLQQSLAPRVGPDDAHASAGHAAYSGFGRTGFQAAAVTAVRIGQQGMFAALYATLLREPSDAGEQPPGVGGTLVELEYRHPFAVVVATASEFRDHFWQGLPLHVAWVSTATEPE